MNKALTWINDPQKTYDQALLIYSEVFGKDARYNFFATGQLRAPGQLHWNLLAERIKVAARRISQKEELDQNFPPEQPMKAPVPQKPIQVTRTPFVAKSDKPRIVDNPLVEVTRLPKPLQELYVENKGLTVKMAEAHAAMKSARTDEQRASFLEQAKTAESKRAKNWKEIDQWWNANKDSLPEGPVAPETNIEKRLDTLRKAINRAENELKTGTLSNDKKKARREKLNAWKREQKDLKKQYGK